MKEDGSDTDEVPCCALYAPGTAKSSCVAERLKDPVVTREIVEVHSGEMSCGTCIPKAEVKCVDKIHLTKSFETRCESGVHSSDKYYYSCADAYNL